MDIVIYSKMSLPHTVTITTFEPVYYRKSLWADYEANNNFCKAAITITITWTLWAGDHCEGKRSNMREKKIATSAYLWKFTTCSSVNNSGAVASNNICERRLTRRETWRALRYYCHVSLRIRNVNEEDIFLVSRGNEEIERRQKKAWKTGREESESERGFPFREKFIIEKYVILDGTIHKWLCFK